MLLLSVNLVILKVLIILWPDSVNLDLIRSHHRCSHSSGGIKRFHSPIYAQEPRGDEKRAKFIGCDFQIFPRSLQLGEEKIKCIANQVWELEVLNLRG